MAAGGANKYRVAIYMGSKFPVTRL